VGRNLFASAEKSRIVGSQIAFSKVGGTTVPLAAERHATKARKMDNGVLARTPILPTALASRKTCDWSHCQILPEVFVVRGGSHLA